MDIIEAAMAWRKSWVDVEDLQEEESGCNCELCQLIRACNQHAAQHHMHLTGLRCPVHGLKMVNGYCPSLTCLYSPPRK